MAVTNRTTYQAAALAPGSQRTGAAEAIAEPVIAAPASYTAAPVSGAILAA